MLLTALAFLYIRGPEGLFAGNKRALAFFHTFYQRFLMVLDSGLRLENAGKRARPFLDRRIRRSRPDADTVCVGPMSVFARLIAIEIFPARGTF